MFQTKKLPNLCLTNIDFLVEIPNLFVEYTNHKEKHIAILSWVTRCKTEIGNE